MHGLRHFMAMVALACPAFAQEDTPPPNPPIAELPTKVAWTRKAVADPAAAATAGKSLLSMTTTKSGDLRRTSSAFSDGARVDVWFTGNVFLIERATSAGRKYKVFDVDPEFPRVPIPSDLSELRWVGADNYAGTVAFEKGKAWQFVAEAIPPASEEANPDDPPPVPVKLQAWVDPETRMPVAFHDGTRLWTYRFAPYEGTLSLPSALALELDKFRERAVRDAKLRSRLP